MCKETTERVRPSWDDYFMDMLEIVKTRSTCIRRQVGALIVKNNRVLATGYNGAPSGITHCNKDNCLRLNQNIKSGERHELCRGTHAEQNAIISAATSGTSIEGATIYITCSPCILCSKMLINARIERIVYSGDYPDQFSLELLKEAGIKLEKYEKKDNNE